jgi:hypothetical protein
MKRTKLQEWEQGQEIEEGLWEEMCKCVKEALDDGLNRLEDIHDYFWDQYKINTHELPFSLEATIQRVKAWGA